MRLIRILWVVWSAPLRLRAAAEVLARAALVDAAGVIVLHALIAGVLVGGTYWLTQTRTTVWVPTPVTSPPRVAASGPASTPASQPASGRVLGRSAPRVWTMPTPRVRRRTLAEVWRDAHATGWFGPIEARTLFTACGFVLCLLLLADLALLPIHRGGRVLDSYARAVVATAPASLLLVFVVAGLTGCRIVVFRQDAPGIEDLIYGIAFFGILPWGLALAAGMSIALGCHIGRLRPAPACEPRCESCGYNLSGHSSADCCPECGRPVADSVPAQHRTAPPWEQPHGAILLMWIETASAVLFQPARFYRTLAVRREVGPALRFELCNFVMLGVLTLAACLALFAAYARHTTPQDFATLAASWIWVVLLCWFGARLLGTVAVASRLYRGIITDGWVLTRVMAYESIFIWPLACWFIGLTLSFARFDAWISRLVDPQSGRLGAVLLWGVPVDIWVLAAGSGLLAVIWLMRYSIALREVRWANA